MSIEPGMRLGPYEVLAQIGAGGMGQVYRARDTRLERSVAIKVLPPEFAKSSQLKMRFEREAKTISQLNHPHICTLYDVGDDYLVMEYIEGENLAERLARGPMPVEQLLKTGAQIAGALDRAHRQGIVHRDVKPGNVMLTKSGAKLLDFGLARGDAPFGKSPVEANEPTVKMPITEQGTIVGTFLYMAPEQLDGRPADARTDIFALGAVLYEMATGRRAFDGKSRTSIIAAIVERDPEPISRVQPLAPRALEHVIQKCLAKDPDDRWQSAHDIAEELRWIAESDGEETAAAKKPRKREAIAWSVAALVLIGFGWLASRLLHAENHPLSTRTMIVPPRGVTFDLNDDNSASLAISPDGKWIVFAAHDGTNDPQLWLRPIDSFDAHPIAGTTNAISPFWSPDSRSIAFFADRSLKRVELSGGPPQIICDAPSNPRGGSWSRDGVILFSPTSLSPIHRVSANGGKSVAITKLREGETTHRWARFLPDGKHFLYLAALHTPGPDSMDTIYAASIDSSQSKAIVHARSNFAYARGFLFYARDSTLVAQRFDPAKLALSGDPVTVTEGVDFQPSFFRSVFDVSDNGTIVGLQALADRRQQLLWLDRTGKASGNIGPPQEYESYTLAPDARHLAMSIVDSTGSTDIWLYDLQRSTSWRFTFSPQEESSPIFSPDSKQILFARSAKKKMSMDFMMKSAAGDDTERTVFTQTSVAPSDWSRDGKNIAYITFDMSGKTKFDIWGFSLTGERKAFPLVTSDGDEVEGRFSPDGKWFLYTSTESGRPEVYGAPFPPTGAKWQITTTGAYAGHWRGDGKEILYLTTSGDVVAVDIDTSAGSLEVGAPKTLFHNPLLTGFEMTNDGMRLVAAQRVAGGDRPLLVINNWSVSS